MARQSGGKARDNTWTPNNGEIQLTPRELGEEKWSDDKEGHMPERSFAVAETQKRKPALQAWLAAKAWKDSTRAVQQS